MLDYLLGVTEKGGWILFPIFLTALIGWSLVILKWFSVQKVTVGIRSRNVARWSAVMTDRWVSKLSSREKLTVVGSAADAVYNARCHGREEMMNRLDETMKFIEPELEKGMPTLANLASTAPLMGLLGTVSGMVGTFKVIKVFGTSNPSMMADSISEALMTTQNGLLVAVPLMIIHILFINRIERIQKDAVFVANKLINYYSGESSS